MVKPKKTVKKSAKPQANTASSALPDQAETFQYCSCPPAPEREFSEDVNPNRARLIQMLADK